MVRRYARDVRPRDPMRPRVLEIPFIWFGLSVVALAAALALARGLTSPDAGGLVSWTITVACLLVAGGVLYAIRRRFIPH
jgi:TRAP-type mannitol/chloroaromatic compound transport system permease small subunit